MTAFPPALASTREQTIACYLALFAALGLLVSPPMANLAELLLVLLIVGNTHLRQELWRTWQQPLTKAVLAFWVAIGIGLLYTEAPTATGISMWNGWRKLLLVPLAFTIFSESHYKRVFLVGLFGALVLAALLSFLFWMLKIDLPRVLPGEHGVLLRNHATQGMAFAVAAFGGCVLAFDANSPLRRFVFVGGAALLAVNIAIVTPGRSGYLVLMICTLAAVTSYLLGQGRLSWKNLGCATIGLATVLTLLALTPTSRERITLAIQETQNHAQASQVTSMGIRIVFWKNSLELISERPWFGYGTGAFKTAYDRKVSGLTGLASTPSGDPHNQYLKIAAEHGLAGLLVFFSILVAATRQRPGLPWRALGLGVLAAWCTTSFANSHFSTFSEGSFIYLWLGVMLAEPRRASPEPLNPAIPLHGKT